MTTPRTRLVQVIPHDRMGGMQEVTHALDEGLAAHGVDSLIVDLERGLAEYPGRLGLPRYWDALRRGWRAGGPDVVMAHTLKNALFTLTAARAAGVERRIAVVHSSRPTLGEARTRILEALSVTGTCTDIVFVGEAAGDSFKGLPGHVHRRAMVIRNGIRLPEPTTGYDPETATTSAGLPQLVVAGRLNPGKGVDIAIRAVQGMEKAAVLHVYGDGDSRSELESLARSGSHPERIVFHGAVSREQLNANYRASDLLLFPSLGEGLPLVLVEAAAAGIPVVAGPLACNREVMGDAAAYTTGTDPEEWTALLAAVLGDPQRRERMVRAGLERVELFSLDRMVRDYARMLTAKT